MSMYDFSSKNFKEFCKDNNLKKNEARNIVFLELSRVLNELEKQRVQEVKK